MNLITSYEKMDEDVQKRKYWTPGKFDNVSKTDTRGFISLPVQIKRYMLAGLQLKVLRDQFTCEDYEQIYKDIPVITQDMDITEIQEFSREVSERMSAIAALKAAQNPSVSPQIVENSATKDGKSFPHEVRETVDSVDAANAVEHSSE